MNTYRYTFLIKDLATQFTMTSIEELGLLKMDFLGLQQPYRHKGRFGADRRKTWSYYRLFKDGL